MRYVKDMQDSASHRKLIGVPMIANCKLQIAAEMKGRKEKYTNSEQPNFQTS